MAHPYTSREHIQRTARDAARVGDLLDADRDGIEDYVGGDTAVDDAIAMACELIDARLGQRYAVPFASLTSTPALITRIASCLVLWDLYARRDPDSSDAKAYWTLADSLLKGILEGTLYLDATQRSAAVRRPVVTLAGSQFSSGVVGDDYTSSGRVPRTRGL